MLEFKLFVPNFDSIESEQRSPTVSERVRIKWCLDFLLEMLVVATKVDLVLVRAKFMQYIG